MASTHSVSLGEPNSEGKARQIFSKIKPAIDRQATLPHAGQSVRPVLPQCSQAPRRPAPEQSVQGQYSRSVPLHARQWLRPAPRPLPHASSVRQKRIRETISWHAPLNRMWALDLVPSRRKQAFSFLPDPRQVGQAQAGHPTRRCPSH
jgi:hypothetical protein